MRGPLVSCAACRGRGSVPDETGGCGNGHWSRPRSRLPGQLGFGYFVPAFGENETDFTFDAGGFLDLAIIPFLNFGIHGAYNRIEANFDSGAYEYATVGLHAALIF